VGRHFAAHRRVGHLLQRDEDLQIFCWSPVYQSANTTTANATTSNSSVNAIAKMVVPSVRSITLQPPRNELEYVDGPDDILHALRPDALLEHDQAERAAARDLRRAAIDREELLDPAVVHPLADLLFHPHASSAGAAAEAALAVVRLDLDALDPGYRVHDRPRFVVDLVVPA